MFCIVTKNAIIKCPLCNDYVSKLIYRFHYDSEKAIIEKIRQEFPEWTKNDGLCSRCLDFFHSEIVMEQRILPSIGPHFSIKTADDFIVIPTGLRMNADPGFTGKGVTICFIDSGFCTHPDLTATKNRIKKIVDVTGSAKTGEESWHGTMTTVVCAGDGFLSNGLYRGIASDAELVLIKVQNDDSKITTGNIVKALEWILEHHREYDIKIVNMSIADDSAVSYKNSAVDQLAEQLAEKGIIVVAAAGNDVTAAIRPPANSPHVITVGGVDDENKLDVPPDKLYHSSFGETVDGLMKPELVAHAIWIAAPILPGTKEQKEAEVLYGVAGTASKDREKNIERIRACKYISAHYMHVDGTSFAAPIVCSIIAQLLEVKPELMPVEIRRILFSTATRITDVDPERQGFGLVQPRKAILKTLRRDKDWKHLPSPQIDHDKKTIGFYLQNDCASQISLAGSFNQWEQDAFLMEPGKDGVWKIEIPMLPQGRYPYKFFLDEKMWIEDIDNPNREPDGFNGFNSILIIEQN